MDCRVRTATNGAGPLDTGVVTEDLASTLTAEQRQGLVDTTDRSGPLSRSMDLDLHTFIAEERSKRLR